MKKLQGVARPLFLCLMVLVVFGAYVVRLIQWQLVQGETFLNQSDAATASYIKLTGARVAVSEKFNPLNFITISRVNPICNGFPICAVVHTTINAMR